MATLTVTGRSDLGDISGEVDDLSRSVSGLSDDVARVDDVARTSGAGLDTLGEAGDNVASKSSQATGALGALAGGLEAVGATGAASALQGVAIATDVASGAGDALNLVAETSVGRFVASTGAKVANTVATTANTVATTAATAATTAFNAVMAANPVALVVIAVVALAAALVVAYKQSETFRNIVDGAFGAAADAVSFVGDKVGDVIGFFRSLPAEATAAWGVVTDKVDAVGDAVSGVIGFFRDIPDEAKDAWGAVTDAVGDTVDDGIDKVGDLVDAVIDGPRDAASTVAGFFASMFAPIRTAVDWVNDLIDKLTNLPDVDLNPLNGRNTGLPGEGDGTRGSGSTLEPVNRISVELKIDPGANRDRDLADLVDGLREFYARQGKTLSLTETPA